MKSPQKDTKELFQKMNILSELSSEHTQDIHTVLISSYESIIISQTNNLDLIATFSHILHTLEKTEHVSPPRSLIKLRSFYHTFHQNNGLYPSFYQDMNTFIDLYDSEVLN
ncbi:MAG: hypothetical protein GY828_01950, partial [Candidatus Gracilibacteria bacterium]|nr:hypothetical protein [Candidatus Gracilibacteria bacterium]